VPQASRSMQVGCGRVDAVPLLHFLLHSAPPFRSAAALASSARRGKLPALGSYRRSVSWIGLMSSADLHPCAVHAQA
jgi:hypothetical protein